MTTAGRIACAACGANVEAAPGADELVCPSCGHRAPIAAVAAAARDDYAALLAEAAAAAPADDTTVLSCATCGARTTAPVTVLAERCPFCATPTVSTSHDRLRRPTAVLPFALDEAAARAAVTAWADGLWFRPAGLGADGGAWSLTAVYLPYWSFDWDVTTEYEGARGHTSDGKTSWTDVTGSVRTRLDGSTVLGSRGIDRERGAELEPWDTERVVGYKPDYLQGVRAEASALSIAEAGDLGHRLLARQIEYEIERDIGGDRQRIDRKATRYHAVTVRLVLMPIWITHAVHRGQRHQVLINARTGEVIGDRPVSRGKLAAVGLAPVAAALAGGALLPSVWWRAMASWRAHLLGFWLVLGALGLLGLIIGSAMVGRVRRREPARQRDLYVQRPGPGSSGLQVDPAAMWRGALQADGVGRGTLVQISGFAAMFVALMPAFVLAFFTDMLMPVIMMHAFSAIAIVAFWWALGRSGRDRRTLLGLDDPARR
jgi:DNA-directed RNA polymerase subunit RPC12/RpoP